MLHAVVNSEDDRTARMRREPAGYAARGDEGLDDFLGHIRHRIATARAMGVDVPGNLAERVEELSDRRGRPPVR